MQRDTLAGLDLLAFGSSIHIAGVIYAGADEHYLAYLPGELDGSAIEHRVLDLDNEAWEKVVRQTDLLETEVLAQSADGKLCKVIVRKSTRQIEQGVSWKVYHRDGYRCRYCAIQGVPMTVDHLVLWEVGGPSIEANLLTACRKCNKTRGNLPYEEWLNHKHYTNVSKNLVPEVREANEAVLKTLADIPIRLHQRNR